MMPWTTRLREPVPLPDGGSLKTLADARAYILALPDEEQKAERGQAAAETLLHAAEHGGGWLEFVHIGLMRALSTEEEQYGPGRRVTKDPKWGHRPLPHVPPLQVGLTPSICVTVAADIARIGGAAVVGLGAVGDDHQYGGGARGGTKCI